MPSYKGHRYPVEIINHRVCCTFGSRSASVRSRNSCSNAVSRSATKRCDAGAPNSGRPTPAGRADAPRPGDKWHCDEVFTRINGTQYYLWRAVDQHGNVLDILVQSRRNAVAAKRFFRPLLKNLEYVPRVIVTDKLGSYQVAHRELLASVEHRRSKYLNNRIENSHQPTRQRERAMKRFTSPGHAQRFLSAFSGISPHFRPGRHRLTAPEWRTEMADRFTVWREVTATVVA